MTEALRAIETAKDYVKKHKGTFTLASVRAKMNLTDAQHNTNQQLKTFEKEYRTIQKTAKRIEKATDAKIKQEYIFRQERAHELLTADVRRWFHHYQQDVIHAVDILINQNMLNRRNRPHRCKPPVCDDRNRYYFGRTVCQGKTLAIRADCEGKLLIQGWLHYDSDTGADVELFTNPMEYTESNVVKFVTDIVILDESPEVLSPAQTEQPKTVTDTLPSLPLKQVVCDEPLAKYNADEDVSEETEYKTLQKHQASNNTPQQDDNDTNNTDAEAESNSSGSDSDSSDSSGSDSDSSGSDSDSSDSESDDELPIATQIAKSAKSAKPTKPILPPPVTNNPGCYVHHKGLQEYLSKHFDYASLNVHQLIMSRYSRRQRLYGLKESTYKKLLTTDASTDVSLKTQSDELRLMLLTLWKRKQFVCHPDVFATVAESRQCEYTYVVDGVL